MRKQTKVQTFTQILQCSFVACAGQEMKDGGQVGLQNGSQIEIDAVTLRTEVDLQAQKLR